MVKFEYALEREKDLNCLIDYYINTKENKKRRLIMRSIYLILALLVGVFTDLYFAVVALVVLAFFLPEFIQKKKLKKHFLSAGSDALYEKGNYTFSENGVIIESNVGLNEYNWDAFIDYSILENYLHIVRKDGALIILNKERIGKNIYDDVLKLVQQNIEKRICNDKDYKKIVLLILSLILIFGTRWLFYEVRFALYVKEFKGDYEIHLAKEQSKQKIKIDYHLEDVTNTKKLCDKLGDISECLDKLPEGLIEEIKEPIYVETKDGMEQLVPPGEIQIIFYDTIGGRANGITEFGIGWDMIALSVNSSGRIDKLFYHEFSHLLEKRNKWKVLIPNSGYYKEWKDVNPEAFEYNSENYNYVMGKCDSKESVAFISEYATTSLDEDRAELFSYLMTLEKRRDFEQLMTYPKIAEKIKYLNTSLVEQYDCLEKDNCFQWQIWLGENK